MRRYKNLVFALFFIGLMPVAAAATVPALSPLNYKTRYDITMGGVSIGRLFITSHERAFDYDLRIDTKTSGLIALFSPIQSVASGQGSRSQNIYVPKLYILNADKDGDDKDRHVRLVYDQGMLTERERHPGDTARYRPIVPLEQASAAADPITGFFMLRQKLRDAMAGQGKEASVDTYDGARLATMKATVISRASIEIDGKFVPAINTVVTRQPVNGYTKKELKKFNEGDPVTHLYFSADERFIPLMFSMSFAYGDVKATLSQISAAN